MTNLLALDWGTSSFRAYLLDGKGNIRESLASDAGLHTVAKKDFETILRDHLGRMAGFQKGMPIVAAGMITSRQGWQETDYLECPISANDLASHLTAFEAASCGTIYFLPGVKQHTPAPDIMRGEECQLAGMDDSSVRVVILPGTHSKWAQVEGGVLQRFSTYMTGDLYRALRQNTMLKVLPESWSEEGFLQGVEQGHLLRKKGGGLLSALFRIRSRNILGEMSDDSSTSFLSGLLLGAEIAEATGQGFHAGDPYLIIADDHLSRIYCQALNHCGLPAEPAPQNMAARGLFTIARLAKLL